MCGDCRQSPSLAASRRAACLSACRSRGRPGGRIWCCGSLTLTSRRPHGTSENGGELEQNSLVRITSIHRPHIIGQHQHEHTVPRRRRAGKDSAAQDFQRGVVGERETIFGGAKRFCKHLQLFVTTDESNGLSFGWGPAPPLSRTKKSALPVSFALPRSMVRRDCKLSLLLFYSQSHSAWRRF